MNCVLPLSQGKTAVVDPEDYDRISQFKWTATRCGKKWYAKRNFRGADGRYRGVYLHHFVLGQKVPVDHRDRDGLNNRRGNLRLCTKAQNAANSDVPKTGRSSRFRGVSLAKNIPKDGPCWHAYIKVDQHKIGLGYFRSESMAAVAYNEAAKKHFGEFARLNVIEAAA